MHTTGRIRGRLLLSVHEHVLNGRAAFQPNREKQGQECTTVPANKCSFYLAWHRPLILISLSSLISGLFEQENTKQISKNHVHLFLLYMVHIKPAS